MWMAVIFKFLSSLFMVVSNTLWKRPIQKEPFIHIIAVRAFLSSLIFAIIFFVVYNYHLAASSQILIGNLNQSVSFWIYTLLLILVSYGGLFYFLKAIHSGKTITVLAPLGGMAQIFSILTAVVFFHETLAWNRVLSICFFIVSIFVYYRLTDNKEDLKWRSKTVLYLLFSCIIWGVTYTLLVKPIRVLGPLTIAFITEVLVFIVSVIQIIISRQASFKFRRPLFEYLYFVVMAFCIVFGMLLNNLSLTLLPISIIILVGLLIEVSYLFIGKWILKESLRKNEWWSFILTTIALLVLVISF
jgi:drug/metabolite transporter (DMT)-like permease